MTMDDLTFCFEEPDYAKPKDDWSQGYRRHDGYEPKRIGHPGPHQVPLGASASFIGGQVDADHDGRWVLREAIALSEYRMDDEPQVAADIALATPLLARQETRPMYVEVTLEEKAALERLLTEAQEYWSLCNYAHDEGSDDDQLLGVLAESGHVRSYAQCHNLGRQTMKED
jgi:hypothetical protein